MRPAGEEVRVKWNDTDSKRVFHRLSIEANAGSPSFRETRTIRHEVTVSETWTAGGKLKLPVMWLFSDTSLNAQIQSSTSVADGKETTIEREIQVTGPCEVQWIETYKAGTVCFKIDGKRVEVPVEIPDGFVLLQAATPATSPAIDRQVNTASPSHLRGLARKKDRNRS